VSPGPVSPGPVSPGPVSPGPGGLLRLVLATANPDKAAEIADILTAHQGIELLARPAGAPDVEETGATLVENARLKALALVAFTGQASVADDTGLEVEALGGAPGVWSARYAGPACSYADNVAKVLAELGALPDGGGERRARFITVALVAFPDGAEVVAEGTVDGWLAAEPRGSGGFGYDPIFVPDGAGGLTFAEMTAADKHIVSHRGRAFRALASRLAAPGVGPAPGPGAQSAGS